MVHQRNPQEDRDMPSDPTEEARRTLQRAFDNTPHTREELETEFGPDDVFDTAKLQEHFTVTSFLAPFVVCRRKSDNMLGTLMFQHAPRLYFGWHPDPTK